MLGKLALVAGAGAAYVLRSPQARARFAQLFAGATGGVGAAGDGDRPQAQLPSAAGRSTSAGTGEQRPRLARVPRLRSGASGGTVPPLVDRRPEGSDVQGVPDELTGAHLLPDATPVEIARAVSEEQSHT